MTTYEVNVTAEYYKSYTVEAESEDEANEIAMSLFNEEHDNDWDRLTANAEEV